MTLASPRRRKVASLFGRAAVDAASSSRVSSSPCSSLSHSSRPYCCSCPFPCSCPSRSRSSSSPCPCSAPADATSRNGHGSALSFENARPVCPRHVRRPSPDLALVHRQALRRGTPARQRVAVTAAPGRTPAASPKWNTAKKGVACRGVVIGPDRGVPVLETASVRVAIAAFATIAKTVRFTLPHPPLVA